VTPKSAVRGPQARLKAYRFQTSPHPLRRPAHVRSVLCAAGQRVSGSGRHAHMTRQTCPSTCSRLSHLRAAAAARRHCSCGCAPGRADTDGIATRSSNERKVCSSWSSRYRSAACVSVPAHRASTFFRLTGAEPGCLFCQKRVGSARSGSPRLARAAHAARTASRSQAGVAHFMAAVLAVHTLTTAGDLHVLQLDLHALRKA